MSEIRVFKCDWCGEDIEFDIIRWDGHMFCSDACVEDYCEEQVREVGL